MSKPPKKLLTLNPQCTHLLHVSLAWPKSLGRLPGKDLSVPYFHDGPFQCNPQKIDLLCMSKYHVSIQSNNHGSDLAMTPDLHSVHLLGCLPILPSHLHILDTYAIWSRHVKIVQEVNNIKENSFQWHFKNENPPVGFIWPLPLTSKGGPLASKTLKVQ